MQFDRRAHEREPVIVEIEPSGELPGKKYSLRNISTTGFKLETDQYMAVGEHFAFSFSLPDSSNTCILGGEVIWVEKISPPSDNYYIGFAFPKRLEKLPELFALPLTGPEKARLGFRVLISE
jgi:hypothetical protein